MRIAALVLVSLSACLMPPANGGGGGTAYPSSSPSGNDREASPGAPAPTATASATPAPEGPVSVTIRSACSKTVKVFYGDKPKFGSGTYSTIDSNSVQSHSFRPGEQLWVVDESENGLGSATIAQG